MNWAFGPRLEADGVRFRLWAPAADRVLLEVEGRGALPMTALADGWKESFVRCGAGTHYRFRIGDTVFPDPASRCQAGGVHGWSVVREPMIQDGWQGRPWEETILYECHPGLMGGFAGIAQRLPGLAQLGITAVELMPIAAFPGARNWGYDGVLPFAPAESYGPPEALKAMIETAHGLGMMVFLDVVYNHFGPDGNYLPIYAAPFFRAGTSTPWGAAIDFRVPQVRQFFAENARYWLFEFGFDGLRFDAVHAIADEGWLGTLAEELRAQPQARRIHLVAENEDNAASHLRRGFDAQWNDDIHHALHVLLTGEDWGYYRDFADGPAARLARALAEGFVYQGDPSPSRQSRPRGESTAGLPPSAFIAFLQNHDQIGNRPFGERLAVLADARALKAAMALLLLCPQIPMLFMGEEIGSRAPFLFFTDHGPELARAVREGRRYEFAAFAAAAGGRQIPDPNDPAVFDASDPERDAPAREEWLVLTKMLLAQRWRHIVPGMKGAQTLGAAAVGGKAILARWALGDGGRLTIAANLGSEAQKAALPEAAPFWGKEAQGFIPPFTTIAWRAA